MLFVPSLISKCSIEPFLGLSVERVRRTVESDQSSTLLPLSDLKTGCGLHEKWARIRITTELCPQKDRKVGKVPRVPNPCAGRAHREQLRLETLEKAERE